MPILVLECIGQKRDCTDLLLQTAPRYIIANEVGPLPVANEIWGEWDGNDDDSGYGQANPPPWSYGGPGGNEAAHYLVEGVERKEIEASEPRQISDEDNRQDHDDHRCHVAYSE